MCPLQMLRMASCKAGRTVGAFMDNTSYTGRAVQQVSHREGTAMQDRPSVQHFIRLSAHTWCVAPATALASYAAA